MSGTRKMEKFEVEAYTKARAANADERAEGTDPTAPQTDAAAAIAAIQPGSAIDDLMGPGAYSVNAGDAELPARPFEPRAPDVGGADLPATQFEPRRAGPADVADLPGLPFEPRTAESSGSGHGGGASAQGAASPSAEPFVPGEWVPPQKSSTSPNGDEQDLEALRTRLARKFVTLADSVTEAFGEFSIGAGAWAVELTAPQGMSTGGGKQALQHLRLRPRREGYAVLVAGTVNQVEKRAELRDFDHITIMHDVRFKNKLDISQQEWEQFLRKAEVVLNASGIQSMRTPPPRELLEQRRSMQRVSKGAVLALVVVLTLAVLVVWRVIVALSAAT